MLQLSETETFNFPRTTTSSTKLDWTRKPQTKAQNSYLTPMLLGTLH